MEGRTETPSVLNRSLGSHATMRKIMKDRQAGRNKQPRTTEIAARKTTATPQHLPPPRPKHHQPSDTGQSQRQGDPYRLSSVASDIEEKKQESITMRVLPNEREAPAVGIPTAVTFEEEIVFDYDAAARQPTPATRTTDEKEILNVSSASSYWAMMGQQYSEDDLDWEKRRSASDPVAMQLLGMSYISSDAPDDSAQDDTADSEKLMQDLLNVGWKDDEESSQFLTPREGLSDNDDNEEEAAAATEPSFEESFQTHSEIDADSSASIPANNDGDDESKPPAALSPFSAFRQNSTGIALDESQAYLKRIRFLEDRLVGESEELSHSKQRDGFLRTVPKTPATTRFAQTPYALRSTIQTKRTAAASMLQTPSGMSVINDSILERNKTLVKEIRFADQTCVELTGQVESLKTQMEMLQSQYERGVAENVALKNERSEANRSSAQAQSEVNALRERLAEALLLEQKSASNTQRMQALESELAVQKATFSAEKQRLEADLSKLQGQLATAHTEIKHQSDIATRALAEKAKVLEDAEKQRNETKQQLAAARKESRNHADNVSRVQAEKVKAYEDADKQRFEAENAKKKMESTALALAGTSKALEDAQNEIKSLRNDRRRAEHTSSSTTEITRKLEATETQLAAAQEKIRRQEDSTALASAKKAKALEDAQNEIKSLSRDLRFANESSNSEVADLKDKLKTTQSELIEIRKALQVSKQGEHTSKVEATQLHKVINQYRSQIDLLKSQVNAEREATKEKAKLIFDTAQAHMSSLHGKFTVKADALESRMAYVSNAIRSFGEEISFETDPLPSLPTDESIKSGWSCLNATFSSTNLHQNYDPELLEEARSHDKLLHSEIVANVDSGIPATVDNSNVRHEEPNDWTTFPGFTGISNVYSEDVSSSISDSTTSSSVQSHGNINSNNDDFLQHLQWLSSPEAVHEKKEDATRSNGRHDHDASSEDALDIDSSASNEQIEVSIHQFEAVKTKLEQTRQERDSLALLLEQSTKTPTDQANEKSAKARLQELQQEKDSIKCELDEKRRAFLEAKEQVAQLQTEVASALEATSELDSLRTQLADVAKQNEEQRDQSASAASRLEDALKNLRECEGECQSLRSALVLAQAEKDEVLASLKATEDQVEVDSHQLAQTDSTLKEAIRKYEQCESECECLRSELDSAQAERDDVVEKLKAKEEHVAEGSHQLLQSETRLKEALDKLSICESERDSLVSALESAQAERDEVVEKLKATEEELEEATDVVCQLEAGTEKGERKNRPRDKLRARFGAMIRKKDGDGMDTKPDKENMRKKKHSVSGRELVDLLDQKRKMELELKSVLTALSEAKQENCRQRARFEDQIGMLERERDTLKEKNETLRKTSEKLQTDEEELSDRLQEVETELKTMKSLFDQKSLELREAQEARRFATVEAVNYKAKVAAVASELEKSRHKITSLENVAESRILQQQHEQIQEELADTQIQLDEHTTKMNEQTNKLVILEEELAGTRLQLQEQAAETTELRSSYSATVDKCMRLRDYIRKLTKKCDEWEEFHECEAQVLQQLKIALSSTRENAAELAERYQLTDHMYTTEKSKAEHLRYAQTELEKELDGIARELSSVGKLVVPMPL